MTTRPHHRSALTLDGSALSFERLARVAAGGSEIRLDPAALTRVAEGRTAFLAAMAGGQAIYGTTTGVGALKTTEHQGAAIAAFNQGLPYAHQFAVGEELPPDHARVTAALRLNTALSGRVGVSTDFVTLLGAMLDHDLLPVLHRRGSVGCGDLGQMGELATVMTGHGTAWLRGEKMPAAEAFARCGITPHQMQVRDSLAAVASNAFGIATSFLVVRRAGRTLRRAMVQAIACAQALGLDRKVWLAARTNGLAEERSTAEWLLAATEALTDWPARASVHDPLSGRMLVHVLSAAAGAISEAARLLAELSGHVDDNPIVVDGQVLTSGNSLLPGPALRLGAVQLALALLARNVFNRCLLLSNGQTAGLPTSLVPPGVIATGYGPLMKLALEQSARVAAAAAPVAVFNQTLAAGLEDEALLIPLSAEKITEQLEALDWLLSVEAVLSAQALDLRGFEPQGCVAPLYRHVRAHIAPLAVDVPLSAPLTALNADLMAEAFIEALITAQPLSKFDTLLGFLPEADRKTGGDHQQERTA